jgi:hypothetical protein
VCFVLFIYFFDLHRVRSGFSTALFSFHSCLLACIDETIRWFIYRAPGLTLISYMGLVSFTDHGVFDDDESPWALPECAHV